MRLKISRLPILVAAVILTLGVACDATSAPSDPNAAVGQSPTPTPVSAEAMQTAQGFAQAHQQIDQEWAQFHTEFDQWRTSLASCDRTAALVTLRGFTSDFSEISRRVASLPRSSSTRSLADRLLEVAGEEETALIRLRDQWQPDAAALFEAVDQSRSAAIIAQREAADDLTGLRESTGPGGLDDARNFSAAFDSVDQDWNALHDSYDALRDDQENLSAADSSDQLGALLQDLDDIKSAISDLPSSDTTKGMIDDLESAADAEEMALSELKDSFDNQESSSNGNGSSSDSTSFDDSDSQVTGADEVREKVGEDLKGILEDSSAQKVGDIDAFRQEFDQLAVDWNAFHDRYYDWLRTEGGCDRQEVADALGQFSLQFGNVAIRVNDLPQASFLRPLNDSMSEAVEREAEALRELRNTWKPFATDSYRAYDQERSNAGKLRRQTDVGVQELLNKFGIAPGEL